VPKNIFPLVALDVEDNVKLPETLVPPLSIGVLIDVEALAVPTTSNLNPESVVPPIITLVVFLIYIASVSTLLLLT
jgi:hypothetical protein